MTTIGMTPRTEPSWQDVDAMWESDAAAQWERENACESDDYPYWCNAEQKLKDAMSMLIKAESLLYKAAEYVKNSTQEDRIVSLADMVTDIDSSVHDQLERMRGM